MLTYANVCRLTYADVCTVCSACSASCYGSKCMRVGSMLTYALRMLTYALRMLTYAAMAASACVSGVRAALGEDTLRMVPLLADVAAYVIICRAYVSMRVLPLLADVDAYVSIRRAYVSMRVVPLLADVCRRMLTYADVCRCMRVGSGLGYAAGGGAAYVC